jgi:hypothetical protein
MCPWLFKDAEPTIIKSCHAAITGESNKQYENSNLYQGDITERVIFTRRPFWTRTIFGS